MTKTTSLIASVLLFSALSLSAKQGNMDKASEHLKQAQAYLEKASHNKAGFRVKAINSVKRALQQIEKGKKAADKSNKKKTNKENKKENKKKTIAFTFKK
ncbi:MAG: hypothetical protein Q9M43_08620 [Sulfurimonas sp.]|nr:hypothetical protein [Sulfurimonas sp.]